MTALALLLAPAVALAADPCGADPPRPGLSFAGTVVRVAEGDRLCLGDGADPAGWIEVRLADFRAPPPDQPRGPGARRSLERLTLGRRAECVAEDLYGRQVVARCRIAGVEIGELMRRAGVKER